jgi:ElaB/YqjD/DUF883 family membrane-anchored ribosome-binding protein
VNVFAGAAGNFFDLPERSTMNSESDSDSDSITSMVMELPQQYREMAREQVRENPLAVVAGAFAIGWLLGKLIR